MSFNEAIYLDRGGRVYADDIEDIIEIREDKTTGSKISFTGTISSDRKTLTITPDEILDMSTYYYIILLDEVIEDAEGNENEKETSKFKTGTQDLAPPKATFSPVNNATNIAVSSNITISFDEAIRLSNNSTVTNSNITGFIELRENSATGTKKSFSASINSTKKSITIDPSADLAIGKNYYVIILANKIEDYDNNAVPKTTSTFQTGLPIAATPTITTNPATTTAIANNGTVSVTMTTSTADSSIRYTTDGTTPTSSSTLYTGAFNVTNSGSLIDGQTITVKAITIKSGMTNSGVASKAITFVTNRVATPTITTNVSNESTVPSNQTVTVTLNTSTSGSTIYYTTDGSAPTITDSLYNGPFPINATNPDGEVISIKVLAIKDGMINSNVATKTITFVKNTVETPTITTDPSNVSNVSNGQSVIVTIVTVTDEATIYYTTDGSDPTESSSLYGGGFSVNTPGGTAGGTVIVKAVAIKDGMIDSSISSKTITFEAAVIGE